MGGASLEQNQEQKGATWKKIEFNFEKILGVKLKKAEYVNFGCIDE